MADNNVSVHAVFHKQLVATIHNLISVKIAGVEAVFCRLDAATERAKEIEPADEEIAQSNRGELEILTAEAGASPVTAVLAAWKRVEAKSQELVEESGLPLIGTPNRPYFNLQSFLERNGVLQPAELNTF